MKAALVISGGGSKGAFAGGVAEFLCEQGKEYSHYIGSSAGSLLAPHLAIGKVKALKEIFSNVCQKDIFSCNPFIISKDKQGNDRLKINHLKVLTQFLKGSKTFGESKNLYQLIRKSYSEEDHEELKHSGKSVIVTVANLTTYEIEYKSIETTSYADALDWIWASANVTPFMSLLRKNGFEYADGGFGNAAPIQKAIDLGCCDVDAIVLENQDKKYYDPPSKNGFELLLKVLSFSLTQIVRNDISIGNLSAWHNKVYLQLYFPHRVLTYHSLIFDSQQMKRWWIEGYEYSKNTNPNQVIIKLNSNK